MKIKHRKQFKPEEKEFILASFDTMPAAEIASYLGCYPEDIIKHIRAAERTTKRKAYIEPIPEKAATAPKLEVAPSLPLEKIDILRGLRSSLVWKKMQEELEQDELKYFEEEYVKLVEQFKEDVVATEDNQIRKAITFDILMRRNMAARKKLLSDISRMEAWQERAARDYKARRETLSDTERQSQEEFLLNLETQLAALRSAEQSKTKEFSDLDTRHQKLMEALKATRDQRFSRVESSKVSFLAVLKDLMKEDRLKQEGKISDLMNKATEQEFERLAKPHVYEDGIADQPILSAETVGKGPTEEDEEDGDE
jgi:hypothetical protein